MTLKIVVIKTYVVRNTEALDYSIMHFEKYFTSKYYGYGNRLVVITTKVNWEAFSDCVFLRGLSFPPGQFRSGYSAISQKRDDLLKWNFHGLILLYTTTFIYGLKQSTSLQNKYITPLKHALFYYFKYKWMLHYVVKLSTFWGFSNSIFI